MSDNQRATSAASAFFCARCVLSRAFRSSAISSRIILLLGFGFTWPSALYAQVNEAWVARYRGPYGSDTVGRALVLDSATNIIVSGGSYGEYATVKYDHNGNEVWDARYHGPGLGDNFARALAVDSAGNIYVTGGSWGDGDNYDYATIKYDANGNELWVARYDGPGHTNDF